MTEAEYKLIAEVLRRALTQLQKCLKNPVLMSPKPMFPTR